MPTPVLDWTLLKQEILPHVHKPARYLGMERGAYRKHPDSVRVRMAMIFPDIYEIGVSNYGHKLLYSLVNNQPDYLCDRSYAPADDMRAALKARNLPLFGLETGMPLTAFEVLAFTLQYELNYTTILGVLDAGHIPFRTADRPDWSTPILISGGPGSGNPMPLAPFFDAFIIGDGEEVLLEVLALVDEAKSKGWTKPQTREALATLDGVFVPGVSQGARKRIVDISKTQIELSPLVPFIQTVHDRVTVEARRGCDRMCRFCQPCFVNLPAREPSIDTIRNSALKEIAKTGYEECSLLSLSIADYSQLKPLIEDVAGALREEGVSLSLPSQRADRFNVDIAEAVQSVRKSTLTFAPEAGTERLRGVINKNLSEAEIMNAVTSAFQAGWNKVKLYFILGLPTETDVDLEGIAALVRKMQDACKALAQDGQRDEKRSRKQFLDVNVTLSNFVPKPHTPFQWSSQDSMAELSRKIAFLKEAFRGFKGVKLNFTDPTISKLEAVISRGDARMADVIETAYAKGAYLEAWDENLLFKEWFEALKDLGIDPDDYTQNAWTDLAAPLPWDGIDMGLERDWLVSEYHKALEAASSEPCFTGCSTCGVCPSFGVQPVFMKPQDVRPAVTEAPSAKLDLFPVGEIRARLTLQKRGDLRFISHLDWLRMLHRAIHRAALPIAYTQGFNPTPRVVFGPALPLFTEGLSELVDLELAQKVPDLVERLNAQLPDEGQILDCQWLPVHGASVEKCLNSVIYSAQWTCGNLQTGYTLQQKVETLLDRPEWIASVKRKSGHQSLDIKPWITEIHLIADDSLRFTVLKDPQGLLLKPVWFLELLDADAHWDVTRERLVLTDLQPALKV